MLRSGDALEEVTSASKEASHNDIYIYILYTINHLVVKRDLISVDDISLHQSSTTLYYTP